MPHGCEADAREPEGKDASCLCFPREQRLRKRREFLAVQRGGRRLHVEDLVVFVRPGAGRRIGVTVSKKVGNAVVRNRVKRLLREAWRHNAHLLPSGFDYVFVAKRSAAERGSFHGFGRQLARVARRVAPEG